jgi:serine/threonine protein kinase
MPRPRDQLKGLSLEGGWIVVEQLPRGQTDTGSNFSTGYIVESPSGQKYFLKAIDFSAALRDMDPARRLQELTEAFNLERDILNLSKRLSCVVTAIKDGTVVLGAGEPTVSTVVQYLILELAENNLRRMAVLSKRLPMSIALKALHNIANGLRQLHQQQIAHQDMKPSNVLKFNGTQFKVGDLGRASIKGRAAPHDQCNIAGDPMYAPLELLYGQVDPEFVVRRIGADVYLLGSLAVFLVTGTPMTALIINEVAPSARPSEWQGTYTQVLPQVQSAFARSLDKVAREIQAEAPYREDLLLCIKQLCEPDVSKRGHPTTRFIRAGHGNVYDLERYLSIFDRLAFKARIFERQQMVK